LIAAFTNDASQVRHTRSINLRKQRDTADSKVNELVSIEIDKILILFSFVI
jgi:hypothetical protein